MSAVLRDKPPSGDDVLSTREVSKLLGVSEATVKRWSDEGLIACDRTPGGHRKFLRSVVAEFTRAHRFSDHVDAAELPSITSEEVIRVGLEGDSRALHRLLHTALERGLPLAELLDLHVAPALTEVGERWACAGFSIAEEHLVSTTLIDALARLADDIPAPPQRAAALVAGLAGERHEFGLRMASLVLRSQGFRVLSTGADTPVADLVRLARSQQVRVVALSAVLPESRPRETLESYLQLLGNAPVRTFVGGSAFRALQPPPRGVELVHDMRSFARLLSAERVSSPI